MHCLICSRSAAANVSRFNTLELQHLTAAVSIAAPAEFVYANERAPSSSGRFDAEALEKGAKALREISSSPLAKQLQVVLGF
ncbi:uncharacterized protein A4U43_C02F12020 [Asparagus officinalis]|uniref:ATPase family AAA domain-containing protein n=1 Tax=Asparagus officinalis TaxID=4686 RepID=A0A5P1FHV3_ASPOF|nr:uncharacterized protein A4U43_C02F12020 [Asparagus officinalis]